MQAEPTMFMMAKDLLSSVHSPSPATSLKTKELKKAHMPEYGLRNPRYV
jgi:hypothetical protein